MSVTPYTHLNLQDENVLLQILIDKLCCLSDGLLNVENFANNAAALAGGLSIGQIYRNGDVLQIVH